MILAILICMCSQDKALHNSDYGVLSSSPWQLTNSSTELLCECNKQTQGILGLDFKLCTSTPGLTSFIYVFLS